MTAHIPLLWSATVPSVPMSVALVHLRTVLVTIMTVVARMTAAIPLGNMTAAVDLLNPTAAEIVAEVLDPVDKGMQIVSQCIQDPTSPTTTPVMVIVVAVVVRVAMKVIHLTPNGEDIVVVRNGGTIHPSNAHA